MSHHSFSVSRSRLTEAAFHANSAAIFSPSACSSIHFWCCAVLCSSVSVFVKAHYCAVDPCSSWHRVKWASRRLGKGKKQTTTATTPHFLQRQKASFQEAERTWTTALSSSNKPSSSVLRLDTATCSNTCWRGLVYTVILKTAHARQDHSPREHVHQFCPPLQRNKERSSDLTERAQTVAVSCGTSHASAVNTPLGGYSKTHYKKLLTHVESHASAVSLLKCGEQRYKKQSTTVSTRLSLPPCN